MQQNFVCNIYYFFFIYLKHFNIDNRRTSKID